MVVKAMNISNDSLFTLWGTLISIAGTIVAFIVKGIKNDIKDAKDQAVQCELEVARHRLHVSENYCDKVTMQSTLERLHNRMDDVADDIKKILSTVGNR